ncbi:MAG TPA: bifunctional 3,4-dihydroxy-2-butanone-4-phosphate synthase/GTP cyclohydrolase II [Gammaproteobacteria bacterium]|jgi:3,4-dihydroxy 2-butanone 4-phosphate synthase/GTP cyclohydrolase II|nr:bifunctional 3,4-dihydroxy-2-butanone-4-phosphate synthase/GTP cyclohydrolase II [Gammaproteobacteria bacterium]
MVTRVTTDTAWSRLDSTEDIVAAIAAGEMVVILDDEDRENEGDLVMAAAKVRAEDINFMARYGRGLICLTLTRQRCEQLRLPLMVSNTDVRRTTNFTISIEAAEGVTTGISAHDRARTVQAAVAPRARPEDLRQPGHIFPLMAQPGGVLTRAGHTEAGCDLARLAGLEPAAVIVEILNDDGSMARRDDLLKFARRHNLKIGTIADLIEYRLRTEQSVEIISESTVTTQFGEFRLVCLEDHVNRAVHLALVRGTIDPSVPTLVRVHRQDTLADVVGVRDPSLHRPLCSALELIASEDRGVVVVLRPEESARDLMHAVQSLGRSEPERDRRPDRRMDFRTFGIGAQILRALGVRRMRVLGAPKQMHALSGFGLEVVEYVSADAAEREDANG